MGLRTFIEGWPVYRQLAGADSLGRGAAARSGRSARLGPRTGSADTVVKSVCPYCAVGCGQDVYVKDPVAPSCHIANPSRNITTGRLVPAKSSSPDDCTRPAAGGCRPHPQ
jgi:formate dehydrogenase major subunit